MHRTEPLPGSTDEVNILTADETSEEIILPVNLSTDKKKAPAEKLALRQKSSINRAIHIFRKPIFFSIPGRWRSAQKNRDLG